jgi:enoyl-CoA hydratase
LIRTIYGNTMEDITYEVHGRVAVITLCRPESRNALRQQTVDQLHAAWMRFAAGDEFVAVMCAQGAHFCAGADLKDMPADVLMGMPNLSVPCDKPVILAVSGYVIGAGASMVLMSDMTVAASDTQFIYPEAKVGAFQGLMGGFPARMPAKVGMQWTMTGAPMSAQRAYEIGFVNEVCEPGKQLEQALALARAIAANAPLVVRALKVLARQTMPKGPVEQNYDNKVMLDGIFESADRREGIAAFGEKRAARFTGR